MKSSRRTPGQREKTKGVEKEIFTRNTRVERGKEKKGITARCEGEKEGKRS